MDKNQKLAKDLVYALGKAEAVAFVKGQVSAHTGAKKKHWHEIHVLVEGKAPPKTARDAWPKAKATKKPAKAKAKPKAPTQKAIIASAIRADKIDRARVAAENRKAKKPSKKHGKKAKTKKTRAPAKAKTAAKTAVKSPKNVDPRAKQVWAWLQKTEPTMQLTYDAKLWSPQEWKAHGAHSDGSLFVITTEGPLHQLVNGYFEGTAGAKLENKFNAMLKKLGLWYDMEDAVTLHFYDK